MTITCSFFAFIAHEFYIFLLLYIAPSTPEYINIYIALFRKVMCSDFPLSGLKCTVSNNFVHKFLTEPT